VGLQQCVGLARELIHCRFSSSRIKRTDATKLQDEYSKLVAGLQDANEGRAEDDDMLTSPGESPSSSRSFRDKLKSAGPQCYPMTCLKKRSPAI
jgi:hypothetical protein